MITISYALLALLLVVALSWLRIGNKKLPPGPFRWPLVGNFVQVAFSKYKYPFIAYTKFAEQYGPIVYYRMGSVNAGLINGVGDYWNKTRIFTVRTLKDYGYGKKETLEMFIRQEVQELGRKIDETIASNEGCLEMCKFFDIPNVNIIWALAAGSRFDYDDPRSLKLVRGIDDVSRALKFSGRIVHSFPILLKFIPESWLGITDYRSSMKSFRRHMEELVESYRAKGTYRVEPENFIDVFLLNIDRASSGEIEDPQGIYTEENLVAVLFDFFWAGSDTSSATLTYGILWLTLHQRVQRNVRRELEEFMEKNHRAPSFSDRNSLPYTQATLLEIARRSTVFPLGPRKVDRDTAFDNYIIPKDCSVLVNFHSVLMDKKFWGDPENFRPERFLDSKNQVVRAERVITFGLGKRNCIAEEFSRVVLFLFTTFLFSSYEFLPMPEVVYETEPIPSIVHAPPPFTVHVKKLDRN